MNTTEYLKQQAVDRYLQSGDFNGLSVRLSELQEIVAIDELKGLIRDGLVDINFGDGHPNPHIKATELDPPDIQIDKIDSGQFDRVCIYPTQKTLADILDADQFSDRPFTRRLALGEPQLKFYAFDLATLEFYRNDPRYHYRCDDLHGQISVSDEYFGSTDMAKKDQVLIQTFGFCFDQELNRYLAVYLWYLRGLNPEHQKVWDARRIDGEFTLHPDYWMSTRGEWPKGVSVFSAFISEQVAVNGLAKRMGKPNLFHKTYLDNERPKNFAFLIRPTAREFNDFIMTLDHMMSDNINKQFFKGDIPLERDIEREDGKIVVEEIGTIPLLDKWLSQHFKTEDQDIINSAIQAFREVRKLRQRPAHSVTPDEFDQKFVKDQRLIIGEAYHAMSALRQVFAYHPANADYEVDGWLETAKIRNF